MAGKIKNSLEYAGWDTDIFDNDTKIDELLDAQGWIGFSIYFYLCQKAYGSDGYFYRWSFANAPTTARKMGGGIGSDTVKQTVGVCLRIGLFDDRLFAEGILTSKGIQKRYVRAIEKRSKRKVDRKYWLLSREESGNVVIVDENEHSLHENEHSLPENDDSLRLSKVNRSKVNRSNSSSNGESTTTTNTVPTVQKYALDNLAFMSQRAMEELESFREDMPDDMIRFAIDDAVDNVKRNWAYVRSILNAYLDAGYKTVGDIKAAQDARRKRKTQLESKADDREKVIWRD